MRVLFALLLSCTLAAALTCQDQTELIAKCDAFFANPGSTVQKIPGDAVGAAARWAFHDSATWDPSTQTGGSQACLAVTNCTNCETDAPENKGLREITDALNNVRAGKMQDGRTIASVIGRADWFFLCCTRAVEVSADPPFPSPIEKVYGRHECPDAAPSFPGMLPAADPRGSNGQSNVFSQYISIFETRLGFTTREWVALIGTHSLGRAEASNSGFNGSWVLGQESKFGAHFYTELDNNPWFRNAINSGPAAGNQQWNEPTGVIPDPGKSFMLATDIALIWNIDGSRTCNITVPTATRCPLEGRTGNSGLSSQAIVNQYIGTGGDALFQTDWTAAWIKLTRLGQKNLNTCTQCGNGVCDAGETKTNCPADCGSGSPPPPPPPSKPATPPTNVRGSRVTTSGMMISWAAGQANDCVFDFWRVTSTSLDFAPPGCGAGALTKRSVTNCNATNIRSGATLQWMVQEICKDISLNSTKSTPSAPVKVLVPGCGNGFCESGETLANCPADCPVCGNNVCEGTEPDWCPQDCAKLVCGNGVCETGETPTSCPSDCKCGNGVCDSGETTANCPADCKAAAGRPTSVVGVNATNTTMRITWKAGAPNSCTFSSWRVTSTALDFPPPGCNGLTSRSVTFCDARGIRTGAVLQWMVQETCTNGQFNSTKSAPSNPVSTTSTTCRIVNQSCPANGQNCCSGTTCTSGVCKMNNEQPEV